MKLTVKAWKGVPLGIRIGYPNRDKYFSKTWKTMEVEIDGKLHSFPLTDAFWRNCAEIRGRVIQEWIEMNGYDKWSHGKPPSFVLEQIKSKSLPSFS